MRGNDAAGPASDLVIGALFALGCLFIPKGHRLADIFFNLAFAAYVGVGVFVVLLFVGARLSWRMLHPPRREYVE